MTDLYDLLRDHLEALDGDIIFAIEAEKFVRNAEPKVLEEWFRTHAVGLVASEMSRIVRAARAASRRDVKRSRFAGAVEAGDPEDLAEFRVLDVPYPVNEEDHQRRLGDMKKEHCLGAAEFYRRSAAPFLLEEAFFRAVARKVGSKTVAEVFSEEQIRALRQNLDGFGRAA